MSLIRDDAGTRPRVRLDPLHRRDTLVAILVGGNLALLGLGFALAAWVRVRSAAQRLTGSGRRRTR